MTIRIDCRGVSADTVEASPEFGAAIGCFQRHGYAILDHVLPEARIGTLNEEFHARYSRFLRDMEADDSREVGRKRYLVPLHFAGGFADPAIFANPVVVALVRSVLEQKAILEAFGAVVSLPGAEAQELHSDGPSLYGSEISALLPAHALTFALPLIEMNDFHGTTSLWPGSHRWRNKDETAAPISPTIPIGSCVLWDFRLLHSGTENKSNQVRPMVYCTYARAWYKDPVNFRKKKAMKRLIFDAGFLDTLPEDTRALLSHAT
jgi:ectoine hydroxylase-related dioxygenase (phytanoyl-CoA dioxygenase family)